MPRIRTVKPEFFTSETMAKCGPWARLLAIGLMQRADSHGRMKWVPRQILGDVFPWDEDVELEPLASELEGCGFLVRYEVDGSKYAEIPAFRDHQRLSGKEAEAESRYPERPEESEGKQRGSVRVFPVKHMESREKEREQGTGKGNREQVHDASASLVSPSGDSSPWKSKQFHEAVIAKYHEHCPDLPAVRLAFWKGERPKNLNARCRDYEPARDIDWWGRFFGYVATIDLLMGRLPPKPDRTDSWQADLGWLLKPENFRKVVEQKYTRGAA